MSDGTGWENEPRYIVIGADDEHGHNQWWHCAEWIKFGGGWGEGGPDYKRPPKGRPTPHGIYQAELDRAKLEAMESEAERDIEWFEGTCR